MKPISFPIHTGKLHVYKEADIPNSGEFPGKFSIIFSGTIQHFQPDFYPASSA